jgi:hypothetical protein
LPGEAHVAGMDADADALVDWVETVLDALQTAD